MGSQCVSKSYVVQIRAPTREFSMASPNAFFLWVDRGYCRQNCRGPGKVHRRGSAAPGSELDAGHELHLAGRSDVCDSPHGSPERRGWGSCIPIGPAAPIEIGVIEDI